MQVLEHEHGRRHFGGFAGERRQHLMRTTATLQEVLELPTYQLRDVDERPQRPRRKQRLTSPPEEPDRRRSLLAEPADHRGLPNPRLAAQQHQTSLPLAEHGCQRVVQHRELLGSLEQLERSRVRAAGLARAVHLDPSRPTR
jgi:hypothetical protein